MPTYSYTCSKCLHEIDLARPIDDRDRLPMCAEPGCDGQQEMIRMLHVSSLSFRGAGWTPKFYGQDD